MVKSEYWRKTENTTPTIVEIFPDTAIAPGTHTSAGQPQKEENSRLAPRQAAIANSADRNHRKEGEELPQAAAGCQKLQYIFIFELKNFQAIVKKKLSKNNVLCTLSNYPFLQFNEVRLILIFIGQMRKLKFRVVMQLLSGGALGRNDVSRKTHTRILLGYPFAANQYSPRAFTMKHWDWQGIGNSSGQVPMLVWGPRMITSGTGRQMYKKNMSCESQGEGREK